MAYKWENESLEKYGKEVTQNLINQQKEYETVNKDNDCQHCGKGNEGTIIEVGKKRVPIIMRYGLWSNGRCHFCGKYTNE